MRRRTRRLPDLAKLDIAKIVTFFNSKQYEKCIINSAKGLEKKTFDFE